MRVLLIDGNHDDARATETLLSGADLRVYAVDSGEEAIDLAKIYEYDLILLNFDMPDMPGIEVLRQIRVAKVQTPVLVLSAEDDIERALKSFSHGADDYVTKPFHSQELIARVRAIVRRAKGHAHSIIHVGRLSVDLDSQIAAIDGKVWIGVEC